MISGHLQREEVFITDEYKLNSRQETRLRSKQSEDLGIWCTHEVARCYRVVLALGFLRKKF